MSEPENPDEPAPAPRGRKTRALIGGISALVILAGLVIWSPWDTADAPADHPSGTTATIPRAEAVLAPLTGVPVDPHDAASLSRPALVAKIDGASQAMPQQGLDSADIVLEVRVEGISRYLAVWHSQPVEQIGPIRSARTTDPDLLAMFVRPLFAYSGANRGVRSDLAESDWFSDVSHQSAQSAYFRERSRRAPHDLMADVAMLREAAEEPGAAPVPVFVYRSREDPIPGVPVTAVSVQVGSDARFGWDPEHQGWRRWAHGREHLSVDGEQLATTNLVVLEVDYVPSPADLSSPEAVSIGSGRAWVYSDGHRQEGAWQRRDPADGWNLTAPDGSPMTLLPGTTWVVLADAPPVEAAP